MLKDGLPGCPNEPCQGRLAVVAVGNQSRQDDGAAAVLLAGMKDPVIPDCCLIDLGTYTSYLAGVIKQHKRVLIIDTAETGRVPGDFTIVPFDRAMHGIAPTIKSSHGLSFFDELLIAARELKEVPNIAFFLVEPGSVAWTEGLSEVLQEALPELLKQLRAHLENEAPLYA